MTDKVLIIIRGLPGSGKSKLAETLAFGNDEGGSFTTICEADEYFVGVDGTYKFEPDKVHLAHQWCFQKARLAVDHGDECVIVSNTATRQWEYKKYIAIAREHGYKVQVIDVHGEFENVHGVPEEHLTKMEERWEPFNRELLIK